MELEKIIITSEDVTGPELVAPSQLMQTVLIPLWWRLLSALLVLCPPLLFLTAIGGLVKIRCLELRVRYVHTLHYCCLLLASGILWTIVLLGLVLFMPDNLVEQVVGVPAISFQVFPKLPSTSTLNGRDIAHELAPLVVVVHHAQSSFLPETGATRQACGAGVIAFADHDGCLVLTSRHVVDGLTRSSCLGKRVGLTMKDGQQTTSTIVGFHRNLDLALLWVSREPSQTGFVQPLRRFKTVEVGEQVFVIGHPEGLEFSLSGGLVSQMRGEDLLQMSAPVSPGNSGGPVYDAHGRLIAIVQSVFDKIKSPNAENLNFAVRADDLLTADAWTLLKEGRLAIVALGAANDLGDSK